MAERLHGLSSQERFACAVAERVTGGTATAWDVGGRQGAVDAMITLPDGQRAAFEVTTVGDSNALQTLSLLRADGYRWPAAGQWWWSITLGSARDYPRLKQVYRRIASVCEHHGVSRPNDLWFNHPLRRVADVTWLVDESSSTMTGHPSVPETQGSLSRGTAVTPSADGGVIDADLKGLRAALGREFATTTLSRHLAKVGRAHADERHLFLAVHHTGLGFSVFNNLAFGSALPPDPPPLPDNVTHLWLAPSHGGRVLRWDGRTWSEHHPGDS